MAQQVAERLVEARDGGRVARGVRRQVGVGGIDPRVARGERLGRERPFNAAIGIGATGDVERRLAHERRVRLAGTVDRVDGEVEEERLIGPARRVRGDERLRLCHEEIGRVDALRAFRRVGAVLGDAHVGVADVARVVVVRVARHVVEETVEIVEAAVERMRRDRLARFAAAGEAPLADGPCRVARVAEDAAERVLFREGAVEAVVLERARALDAARQERGARRRADGRGAVVVGQHRALVRKAVEVRRGDARGGAGGGLVLPREADVAVAEVVGENEDDVGPVLRRGERGTGGHQRHGQREEAADDTVLVGRLHGFSIPKSTVARNARTALKHPSF